MTIDASKIRPGDEVTIRARAQAGYGDCITVALVLGGGITCGLTVPFSTVATHTAAPRALEVGDCVEARNGGRGSIKHIIDGRAWVDWSNGRQTVSQLCDLELVA